MKLLGLNVAGECGGEIGLLWRRRNAVSRVDHPRKHSEEELVKNVGARVWHTCSREFRGCRSTGVSLRANRRHSNSKYGILIFIK